MQARRARVTRGSDKWETLEEAVRHGRLHSGEAGISGIRKEIQRVINEDMKLGFAKGLGRMKGTAATPQPTTAAPIREKNNSFERKPRVTSRL